jgi:hypothetical protein
MTKIDVAPVSAIACEVAIVIALSCSADAFPTIWRAVAANELSGRNGGSGRWRVQLEVTTVFSSSSTIGPKEYWMGSKEEVVAETKSLNLFAAHTFSAPNRQAFPGRSVLCIPIVHALHPAASFCWALSREKVTS